MVEDTDKNIRSEGSFYSNETYEFHEYADMLPLMNQADIEGLGISIEQNGQQDDIDLFENKILDGRNRYLACHGRGITPRFCRYDNHLDPLDYVKVKNFERRHLNTAQRAEVALNFFEIEKKRAKERQKLTQFNGKDKNNSPKFKSSVVDKLSPTEKKPKKGRSIVLAAEEWEISPTTLKKVKKIKKVAETYPEIQKQWEQAKDKEISIEEVYRNVQALETKDKEKPNQRELLSMTEQIINAARSDSEIKNQLEKAKNNEITLEEANENTEKINNFNKSIRKHTVANFVKAGVKFKANKSKDNKDGGTQPKQKITVNKKETTKLSSVRRKYMCERCPKATVMAVVCESCGHPTAKVLCDNDMTNGSRKLRNPGSQLCENSPDYDLVLKRDF